MVKQERILKFATFECQLRSCQFIVKWGGMLTQPFLLIVPI